MENTKKDGVVANPKGNNAQKYKNAKNNGSENSYILSYPQYAPLGKRNKSIPATADANTHKSASVKRVVYRKNGKTIVNPK